MRVLLVLAALLLASASAHAQPPPVQLRADFESAVLDRYMEVYRTDDHDLTIDRVRTQDFAPIDRHTPNFGFSDQVFWFRVRALNVDSPHQNQVLHIDYALLDDIQLFVYNGRGELLGQTSSGDTRDFGQRAFNYRQFNFMISLPRGEVRDLYLRVRSKSSIQVPLRLQSLSHFFAEMSTQQIAQGIYFGIVLGLMAFNLALLVSTRNAQYLYYLLYLASFATLMAAVNGLAFQYLFPRQPALANHIVPISIALSSAAMLQFVRAYLSVGSTMPRTDRVLLVLVFGALGLAIVSPFIDYRLATMIGTAFAPLLSVIVLGLGVMMSYHGFAPARYLVLAWTLLLLGVGAYAFVSLGLLPKVFLTEYGIQIGSAGELVLLSLALIWRIEAYHDERERIAADARELLEARVADRTRELALAMTDLKRANMRLSEYSRHDSLTQVYNRRYLDETFDAIWSSGAGPVAFLMLDLDHFKRVNDDHGHAAGDECLRRVAETIRRLIRPSDLVARYGGEEFIVLMPGADEPIAVARAEQIRIEISQLAFEFDGQPLALTISIGIACTSDPYLESHAALLDRADRALYKAKNNGRNRVESG